MFVEKLVVWQKSMQVVENVVRAAGSLPSEERYGIRQQMTRAAISVPSNIAEGWLRDSFKEKARFLAIAQGSVAELNTQLLICERVGWLRKDELEETYSLVDEVSRMLTALRRKFRSPTTP